MNWNSCYRYFVILLLLAPPVLADNDRVQPPTNISGCSASSLQQPAKPAISSIIPYLIAVPSPVAATLPRKQGGYLVGVSFSIPKDGAVKNCKIEHSSGDKRLDDSVQNALLSSRFRAFA